MATHGEKPRPPAGRFDGRLRGAFHGHRQQGGALQTVGNGYEVAPASTCCSVKTEIDDHAGEASKPIKLEEFVRNQKIRLLRPQPEPNHSMANRRSRHSRSRALPSPLQATGVHAP